MFLPCASHFYLCPIIVFAYAPSPQNIEFADHQTNIPTKLLICLFPIARWMLQSDRCAQKVVLM